MKWLNTYRILREMNDRLRWSQEDLRRFQFWKLRELVRHAYFNSPFYHQWYDRNGLSPEKIRDFGDLTKIAIVDKAMLLNADPMQVCTAKSGGEIFIEKTSGSTGHPLQIPRTWRDLYYIKAKVIRAFRQTGFRFYHRQAVLKSSTESITGRHWFENFGILRKYWLAVTDSPEVNVKMLRRIRPQHLHGYPSGLLEIAEYLEIQGKSLRIPLICCGAEVLDEAMRAMIQRVFEAQVFDLYGSREVGNIAWECAQHQGLHVNEDAIILELLDENGQEVAAGSEGDVVVTYLDGYDYPFIRYRLWDRAVRLEGECSCGVKFTRLHQITGRSDSRIRLPSGEWISGLVFQELRALPDVAAFRIVQDDTSSLKLQLWSKEILTPNRIDEIAQKTSALARHQLRIVPEILTSFPRDESGKLRAVQCRLNAKT
ncbi:MAG TPA: AMP-binding protein [bacterium]|jgi:phenylacetate-CoA ligase